jgi:DNA-directed RNA polymerase specialized sigma24 family protein
MLRAARKQRAGEAIEAPLALMKTIAWRRGLDLLRERDTVMPRSAGELLDMVADATPSPKRKQ